LAPAAEEKFDPMKGLLDEVKKDSDAAAAKKP
jgi:hypothetical protein